MDASGHGEHGELEASVDNIPFNHSQTIDLGERCHPTSRSTSTIGVPRILEFETRETFEGSDFPSGLDNKFHGAE